MFRYWYLHLSHKKLITKFFFHSPNFFLLIFCFRIFGSWKNFTVLLFYYFTMGLKLSHKNYFCLFLCTSSLYICTCNRFFWEAPICRDKWVQKSNQFIGFIILYGLNEFTLLLDELKQGPKVHNVHTEPSVKI